MGKMVFTFKNRYSKMSDYVGLGLLTEFDPDNDRERNIEVQSNTYFDSDNKAVSFDHEMAESFNFYNIIHNLCFRISYDFTPKYSFNAEYTNDAENIKVSVEVKNETFTATKNVNGSEETFECEYFLNVWEEHELKNFLNFLHGIDEEDFEDFDD